MLDSTTKKRIDDLRNILVGKIPSPQSQVEQITTGLIYKFMYDMDQEAVEMGGVPSFFVNDFEKYSWQNLFDPKLSGVQKVQLYSDAIEHMYTNPTAPQLFREIFKNSFLPFKDPATLNMFLKEINEFHYSHSEKLGDAFEYLLSFMGSQGDAGQFRTPRHIIDFVIEIVNPQKNENILDPACGTAGFLISSYKHILNQNTNQKLGDKLTASDRKRIGENLVGYDISPDMTRLSLVNMYLHQFANPQIHEYDTLSSEERWNEYYDVILANPPFFSPSGGIQPHTRFGVQSTRAEVLFVDYIMEHLKPTGRAGIVVPEGVIFQTGTAYKTLRKKLVEDCLVGVISLPAGVFQPYSGVKTSVLILDKKLNQKIDRIFFAKIENDGFSLGSQRTAISHDDLPKLKEKIKYFFEGNHENDENLWAEKKDKILLNSIHSLVGGNYRDVAVTNTDWELVPIGDICEINRDSCNPDELFGDSSFIYLDISSIENGTGKIGLNNRILTKEAPSRAKRRVSIGDVLVSSVRPNLRGFGLVNFDTSEVIVSTGFLVLSPSNRVIPQYLLHNLLSDNCIDQMSARMGRGNYPSINSSDIKDIKIPLPPIEIQQQIVGELESYQKIVDGCRQVIENYKPTIDIDPSWKMVELNEVCSLQNGYAFSSTDMHDEKIDGSLPIIKIGNVGRDGTTDLDCKYHLFTQRFEAFLLEENDLVIAMTGATVGKVSCIPNGRYLLNQRVGKLVINNNSFSRDFVKLCILSNRFYDYCQSTAAGGAQGNISSEQILKFSIPKLHLNKQNELVMHQQQIQSVINGNKRLIEIYTQKIQDRISKVWGN